MNLGEWGCEGLYWVQVAQNRTQWRAYLTTVINLRVP